LLEVFAGSRRISFAVGLRLTCCKERQIAKRTLGLALVSPAARQSAHDVPGLVLPALRRRKLGLVEARIRAADLSQPIIGARWRGISVPRVAEAGRRQSPFPEVAIGVVLELARPDRR